MAGKIAIIKEDLPQLNIEDLEVACLQLPQVDCPVIHRFSPGIYIREVHIPADTFAIGHYQKKEHLNIFLQGKVTMLNDDGSTIELIAPMIFVGKPGRKCGYIQEDMVWLNVYPTEERDIETLENTFLDKTLSWKLINELRQKKERLHIEDHDDYRKVLSEFGFNEETVRAQTEDEEDQIPLPEGGYKIAISDSPIEGKGVFATSTMEPGEIIAPARIGAKRTPVGRFVNHAKIPNAMMIKSGNNINLVALRKIEGCKGGFLGEEITVDYRSNLKLIGVKPCPQ